MAHPAVGGKGLPPVVSAPVYIPSSPAASSVVSGYAPPSHLPSSYHATTAGPPPDLTVRIQLKLRYLRLQSKYNRSIEVSLSPSFFFLFYPTSHSVLTACAGTHCRHVKTSKSNSQRRKRPSSGYRTKSSTRVLLSFPPLARSSLAHLCLRSPLPVLVTA